MQDTATRSAASAQAQAQAPAKKGAPWWREPTMWLVVGGPSAVVVASFATLALAIIHPDPVVSRAPESSAHQAADDVGDASLEPAQKARNHAATGGQAAR